ncbi:uncharacterized protein LY89DRAFT_336496 [Mollisia scopiformis]|uniref:Uncharacterized protein n=1 Tax=Mollisia scopiformis TaxID=149040 RepID=A0A132B733_MOLSC|nr:uncharacterized protein LY89DRAFT_336496 [Mollisia scopiformis]KUJ08151.1 hypothetical protein LY89DRAFT_336496 [Mollisia scopiformis]
MDARTWEFRDRSFGGFFLASVLLYLYSRVFEVVWNFRCTLLSSLHLCGPVCCCLFEALSSWGKGICSSRQMMQSCIKSKFPSRGSRGHLHFSITLVRLFPSAPLS